MLHSNSNSPLMQIILISTKGQNEWSSKLYTSTNKGLLPINSHHPLKCTTQTNS